MFTMRGNRVNGLLLGILVWLAAMPLQAQTTFYKGARLIIGNGTVIDNGAFVVEGNRFTSVGRSNELSPPAGAEVVDLSGKTVMPAIIDTHKHLANERDILVAQLRDLARYGVSAVMSLGQDTTDIAFEVHEEMIPGTARVYSAGRGITMPEPGRSDAPIWVKTKDEALRAVKSQIDRQVDFIKIWVDDRNGQFQKLTPEMYTAIIEEAHKFNTPVAAHIFAMDDAKGLLRAGVDVFAHGVRDRDIDDETVELFRQHPDVYLVPNLPERGVATDMSWLKGWIPDNDLAKVQSGMVDDPKAQEFFGIQARNMDRLNKAGVKIAFGTDGSVLWEHHLELENMVAAGMTPAQAITAATKTSAELMRLSDAGTLGKDNLADFLVLDANPLEDIRNTRRLNAVYIRGVKVER